MQLDPNTFYIACVIADGRRYWSKPMKGCDCSSINVERTTVEDIGILLGDFSFYDLRRAERIEVYTTPTQPILTIEGERLHLTNSQDVL